MVTANSAIVPNFIFPLNNKSSNSQTRKKAFSFRDGIIIVTVPIFSTQNVYECLQKACDFFEIPAPDPSEILPVILHTPATLPIAHVKGLAGMVRVENSDFMVRNIANWTADYGTYFDIPVGPESLKPYKWGLASPEDPLPTHRQQIMEIEHVKEVYKSVIDSRPFRDRLVPSAKMEAARRKHLVLPMQREVLAEESDLRAAAEEAALATLSSGFLLTRDGMKRPLLQAGVQGIGGDKNRIEAWRQQVARELRMSSWHEMNCGRKFAGIGEHQERKRQEARAIENARKWRGQAENPKKDNEERGYNGGKKLEANSVNRSRSAREKEILSLETWRSKVSGSVKVPGHVPKPAPDTKEETKPVENAKEGSKKWLTQGKRDLLNDLRKFSGMRLSTPVPEDLLPIMKKGQRRAA